MEEQTKMACPKCGGRTLVIDSRPVYDVSIRRRRECVECGYKFTTYEWRMESVGRILLNERKKLKDLRNEIVPFMDQVDRKLDDLFNMMRFLCPRAWKVLMPEGEGDKYEEQPIIQDNTS